MSLEGTALETLYRIDERTLTLARDFKQLKESVESSYVTQLEFEPIKRLMYGMVGIALTSVILAVLAIVLKQSS